MNAAAQYRPISAFQLFGLTSGAFFLMTAFAGCSAVFPPLLIITLPGIIAVPAIVFMLYRKALCGPCPYCGGKCGPAFRAFDCRNCRKRILLSAGAFARVPE